MKQSKQIFEVQFSQLREVQSDDKEFTISKDLAVDLGKFQYRVFQNQKHSLDFIQNNLFADTSNINNNQIMRDPRTYIQCQYSQEKKQEGENFICICSIENTGFYNLLNLKVQIFLQKTEQNLKQEQFMISENEVLSLKVQEVISVPINLKFDSAIHDIMIKVLYYEQRSDAFSGLQKFEHLLKVIPERAIKIQTKQIDNKLFSSNELLYQIQFFNESKRDLIIKNIHFNQFKQFQINLSQSRINVLEGYIRPQIFNTNFYAEESLSVFLVIPNFQQLIQLIHQFSQKMNKQLSLKQQTENVNFGEIHIDFIFQDKFNDSCSLDFNINYAIQEKFPLKLIALNTEQLICKEQQISLLECILINNNRIQLTTMSRNLNNNLHIKFDKTPKEDYPINIHKILVEGDRTQGIYDLKENGQLFIKFIFFPKVKGIFQFKQFSIYNLNNRNQEEVTFEAPFIIVNEQ